MGGRHGLHAQRAPSLSRLWDRRKFGLWHRGGALEIGERKEICSGTPGSSASAGLGGLCLVGCCSKRSNSQWQIRVAAHGHVTSTCAAAIQRRGLGVSTAASRFAGLAPVARHTRLSAALSQLAGHPRHGHSPSAPLTVTQGALLSGTDHKDAASAPNPRQLPNARQLTHIASLWPYIWRHPAMLLAAFVALVAS